MIVPTGSTGLLTHWGDWLSAGAWLVALSSGAGLLAALWAWARSRASSWTWPERALVSTIVICGLVFSFLALPHANYRYEGEDLGYIETLNDFGRDLAPTELLLLEQGRMGRLHLALVLAWHRGVAVPLAAAYAKAQGAETPPASAQRRALPPDRDSYYSPTRPDPAYGWRLVGAATWTLTLAFLFGIARRWGAGPLPAAAGVALAMSAPGILFHANCLSDHLAAGAVIVVGLHLQLRRFANGTLLSRAGLLEGAFVLGAAFHTHWTSLFLLAPLVLLRLLSSSTSTKQRVAHSFGLGLVAMTTVLLELPRVLAASKTAAAGKFANYPAEGGLALLSHKHLLANLRPSLLSEFLAPAGEPAFILLAAIGTLALWLKPPPGGRTVLAVVGGTMTVVLVLCFVHIHPGSRWLLPLNMWMAVLIACGAQALLTLPRAGRWPGRVAAALLLLGTAHSAWSGTQDLKDGWFADAPDSFVELKETLPKVGFDRLADAFVPPSATRPLNVIANPTRRFPIAQELWRPGDGLRLYRPPVVTWSSTFVDHPSVYLVGGADFGWSASFRRDYVAQVRANFGLRPAYVVGPFVAYELSSGTASTAD